MTLKRWGELKTIREGANIDGHRKLGVTGDLLPQNINRDAEQQFR